MLIILKQGITRETLEYARGKVDGIVAIREQRLTLGLCDFRLWALNRLYLR